MVITSTFTFHFHALEKEMATHSSVLAWRIPGTGEPGGLPSWGLTESDMTEATQQQQQQQHTGVPVVEQASQNGSHQCLCPQGELQLPPASVGSTLRSACRFDSSFFQIISALGLGEYEIFVYTIQEWSLYFPQPSGSPESKPHWPSKSNVLWVYLPGLGLQAWGVQHGAQITLSLGRTSSIAIILFLSHPTRSMSLNCTAISHLLSISLQFLLTFSFRFFLVDFSLSYQQLLCKQLQFGCVNERR